MNSDIFEKYLKDKEPSKHEKGYAWATGIGLQAVDGLTPSEYLRNTAIKNIEGEISIDQAQELIDSYYQSKPTVSDDHERIEEADKVTVRIAKLLSENGFALSLSHYVSIHRTLFEGIFDFAGEIRNYNITKKEWVLDGDTVLYESASNIRMAIEYDLNNEKYFNYAGLSTDEMIEHLAKFVADLWQIHAFGEGNTRTTAVFFIKYLRYIGINVSNDVFAQNSSYFRNALVRANYANAKKGIKPTTRYLELFLRNLILGESNDLHSRYLHISGSIKPQKVDINKEKVDIGIQKVDIQEKDVDIKTDKALFEDLILRKGNSFTAKTMNHIFHLFKEFGFETAFGRTAVMKTLNLKASSASKFLNNLLMSGIIEKVPGYGKGKYRFSKGMDQSSNG